MPRACAIAKMPSIFLRVTAGSNPRSTSLPPKATIIASISGVRLHSTRFNPPELVSPDTPALTTRTSAPLSASHARICGTNPSRSTNPYPCVRLSPNARICTVSARNGADINEIATSNVAITLPMAPAPPYVTKRSNFRQYFMASPQTDPVLSLSDVTLTLAGNAGAVQILHGITLDVARGETLGLVGPSGSGKSSLLMLMGGLERASTGDVRALGQDLTPMDEDQLARFRRDHMGVVFQSFHLIPTMTALENVATPLELAGKSDAFDRAMEELQTVGLESRAHHYPAQMSGGEQQRVALARASAPRPEILLADEPTGNLDGSNGQAIMDLLLGLRDRHGATLVMVTHAAELAALCDRVVTLRDGKIATDTAQTTEKAAQ